MHALQTESIDDVTFRTILHVFYKFSGNTDAVASNRKDTATVFYQLISKCQKIYEINAPECLPQDIKDIILTSFSNIEHLFNEAKDDEKDTSYIKTIWFLSELKSKVALNRVNDIDLKLLREFAEILLDVLDDIRFLFDITDERGETVFPINKVIAAVIKGSDFMSSEKGIKKEDIRVLQLAVRLFSASEKVVIDTLRNRCNLGFINYLGTNCEIIDTIDFLNYQHNGTIIFYNAGEKKILIRSENKGYFTKCKDYGHSLEEEKDYDGNSIGWYVQYALNKGDKLIDYSSLLKEERPRIEFLKFLFDQGYYNVFLQKSIVQSDDGSIYPANIYCGQDEVIVKGRLNDRAGKVTRKENLIELLQEYRITAVKSVDMNYVTFGLCARMLGIFNTGVDKLGIERLTDDRWYQEQVISNWIECADEASVVRFLNIWYEQLRYFEIPQDLDGIPIHAIDILPLSQVVDVIYRKLCPSMGLYERVFCGTLIYEEEQYVIEVSLRDTITSNELRQKVRNLDVSINELDDEEGYYNWETLVGAKIYFLYSPTLKKGQIIEPEIAKTISGLEWILAKCLPFSVGSSVTDIEYEETKKRMLLYKDAYKEVAHDVKLCTSEDFESQVYLRILHNMIWSNINIKNKNDYFRIIRSHQIADFQEIDKDDYFLRTDETALYLPKDAEDQGAVLSDIYNKRLKSNSERDEHALYRAKIQKNEDGLYTINNRIIKRIILLTDNFASGYSTKAAISAYFGINSSCQRVMKAAEKMHMLFCDGNPVTIKDIVDTNEDVKFSVHSYYGTEEGRQAIDDFLHEQGISFEHSSYNKELKNIAGDVVEQAKEIWGSKTGKIKSDHRLYIREYNMPRSTVFPYGMCGASKLAINLFVRRPELNERRKPFQKEK